MATFSLSPSVDVTEKNLTLIVPAVATSIGAFAGVFAWGPVNEIVTVDSENTLVRIFGEPEQHTDRDFLTAASFLAYTNHAKITRVVGDDARNAFSGTAVAAPVVKNLTHYEEVISSITDTSFIAKYPGVKGNSITVSVADSATFATWQYRELFGSAINSNKVASITDASTSVVFSANGTVGIAVGDFVSGTGIAAGTTVTAVTATTVTLSAAATATNATAALVFTKYTGIPGTSAYVESKGGSNDEIHVVVIDKDGVWSGAKGAVLERYVALSKARDAKDYSGASAYYANVLNRSSNYVWFGGEHAATNWGALSNSDFDSLTVAVVASLASGVDDNDNISVSNRLEGYAPYLKAEEVDVNLIIASGADSSADQLVINNYITQIAETRKDCVAFRAAPLDSVVGNTGNELQSLISFHGLMNSSEYAMNSSGWKLVYNIYSDANTWVPLSTDVAGLCAHTDAVAEAWYSPAGLNRGFIKNVIKLAYNPGSKAERDTLYVNSINPVCIIPGEGVVLYGDKTAVSKPSAFDRINVRRLFIVLEKAIATAAKYQLFEFNDAFTRAQFVNMVTPYLRNVMGRRGVTGFKVVCDETNNTPQVIDSNQFKAAIFVKPSRVINFIELTFIATPTGVEFSEVIAAAN